MKGLLGGILIAVGILIAGATGLCSLLVLGSSSSGDWLGSLVTVLSFAVIPGAIGVGLVFAGRRLVRSHRSED